MAKRQWINTIASLDPEEQAETMALIANIKQSAVVQPNKQTLVKNTAVNPERDIGEVKEKLWPNPLREEAYHGLTGEAIRQIEAYSEADPAALLVTWLVMVGNLLHRSPSFTVGADDHHCNLFAAIVGPSGKGRKGMSANFIKKVLGTVDEPWANKKITSGLTSGEGLIFAVRDEVVIRQAVKNPKTKEIERYQDVIDDEGIADKRLMVIEGEFAQALKVMARQGNTLSPVIRQAWDNGNLNSLVKNFKNRATNAHISIIGHITIYELQDLLKEVEMVNGFGNRFLWVLAKRSKYLPEGAALPKSIINSLSIKMAEVIQFAGVHTILRDSESRETEGKTDFVPIEMIRDPETAEYWKSIYPILSQEESGLCGAMINRAEAQVLRLSMLYALLDLSSTITTEHLNAALAVWDYCNASARYLFGGRSSNPTAEEILIALEAKGEMTQNDLVNLFDRHKPAATIKKALEELQEQGLIKQAKVQTIDKNNKPNRMVIKWSLSNTTSEKREIREEPN